MILQIQEIQPEDRKHLHCTDPRVIDEVAAVNRSLARLEESITPWCFIEPGFPSNGEVVIPGDRNPWRPYSLNPPCR